MNYCLRTDFRGKNFSLHTH